LNEHRGVHPRVGATDVVPLIPLAGATLRDCMQYALELGRRVWESYQIPVYFYEASATRPERTNLENIRRGQFEAIRDEIATVESRRPDVGEPRLHPTAGAVVIGARNFLVAYNIFLETTDVLIARKIARAVRFSSGGLPAVKAMGVQVRGQAQVSMNLTDTGVTPIARVFEFVQREAERYGTRVQSSELIGLIPRQALEAAAASFLKIEGFNSSMVLEHRLDEVRNAEFIERFRAECSPLSAGELIQRAIGRVEIDLQSQEVQGDNAVAAKLRHALTQLKSALQDIV
jgi:glutamate formiminotransferase / formiminotetrahydrofolate cyclodeaminase